MSAGKSGSVDGVSLARRDEPTSAAAEKANNTSNLEMVEQGSRSNRAILNKDQTFDLLKNSRRRRTILYLCEHGGSAELRDLAEYIAAEETNTMVRQLSSDQRKRVSVGLYQCHLPKMDDLGVIDYNKNRGTIELQESATQLLPYLEPMEGTKRTRREWIVPAFAICLVILISLGTFGVGSFSAISPSGGMLVSVGGIAVLVGIQYLW